MGNFTSHDRQLATSCREVTWQYVSPELRVKTGLAIHIHRALSTAIYTPQTVQCLYTRSAFAAAAAKSLRSCPSLCDPIDGSSPGSPVPGILQARTLEWVAISFSNAWKWKVKVKSLNCVRLFATPWTAAYQAPPSMGFSRQEYRSGVPLPSPGVFYPALNVQGNMLCWGWNQSNMAKSV